MSDAINITVQSKDELKTIYLRFLKRGGIMVQHEIPLEMAQSLQVSISLWDETDLISCDARVVWIAPETANTPKYKGYGVEFVGENAARIQKSIELHLTSSH